MNAKLLIFSFLITSSYTDFLYGARPNRRTKNSIQNRQALQIKYMDKKIEPMSEPMNKIGTIKKINEKKMNVCVALVLVHAMTSLAIIGPMVALAIDHYGLLKLNVTRS